MQEKQLGNGEETFFPPRMEWRVTSTSTVNPDEREFIVDSRASMHMMSKMELTPEELETVNVSRLPTTVITANGSIETTEEATVFVTGLDMSVNVQLTEDTAAFIRLERSSNTKLV